MRKSTTLLIGTVTSITFALYLLLVIKVLLFKFGPIEFKTVFSYMSSSFSNPELIRERLLTHGNLIPFHEIRNYLTNLMVGGSTISNVNFIGNMIAFLPFGFLLPFLPQQKNRSFVTVTFLAFLFSLCLETVQLLASMGTFDVDDLLLNTAGGMLGYAGFKLCRLIFTHRPQKNTAVQERAV